MQNSTRIVTVVLLLWLGIAAGPAHAALQDLESIRQTAYDFLVRQTAAEPIPPRIRMGRLDARLRLAACDGELGAFLPGAGRIAANTVIGVRCQGVKPWTVFVQAKVTLTRNVVVAARALLRGTIISAEDVRLEPREVSRLRRGFVESIGQLTGMQVARTLSPGTVVTVNAVAPPKLVRRGERVSIVAQAGGLLVRSDALALADGVIGEHIRVKNLVSQRIVDARVIGPGRVLVQL